ncbi:MAG TPA: hypothetical protein VGM94_03760 [Galbitalea sp.]|jgi:hypothetical protein
MPARTPDEPDDTTDESLDELVSTLKGLGVQEFRIWSRTANAYVVSEWTEPSGVEDETG